MTFSLCVHNGFYFFWIQPSPFGTYAKALGMTQDDFGSCHQFWIDLENGTCFQPTQVLPRGLIGGVNRSRYESLRVASSCLALNYSLSHPGLHRLERLVLEVLEAGRNWRNSSCTVLFVSFVSCLTVEDWWQSGRWNWWEKETGIHWNTMQVLQKCRFEKAWRWAELGCVQERFPETFQRLSGDLRPDALGVRFDVCRAEVLCAPGLWHSNFDEGPLVRRVASTTLVKHSDDNSVFFLFGGSWARTRKNQRCDEREIPGTLGSSVSPLSGFSIFSFRRQAWCGKHRFFYFTFNFIDQTDL